MRRGMRGLLTQRCKTRHNTLTPFSEQNDKLPAEAAMQARPWRATRQALRSLGSQLLSTPGRSFARTAARPPAAPAGAPLLGSRQSRVPTAGSAGAAGQVQLVARLLRLWRPIIGRQSHQPSVLHTPGILATSVPRPIAAVNRRVGRRPRAADGTGPLDQTPRPHTQHDMMMVQQTNYTMIYWSMRRSRADPHRTPARARLHARTHHQAICFRRCTDEHWRHVAMRVNA